MEYIPRSFLVPGSTWGVGLIALHVALLVRTDSDHARR